MTTKLIPIADITVASAVRQRKDVGDTSELQASFRRTGQINPITVTPDLILIAGERRLTAARELGWDMILATIREEEPTEQQRLVELEENLSREELPWKDHCLALYDLHQLLSEKGDWSYGKTAKYTGSSTSEIHRRIMVAEAILAGDEFTCKADRYSVAVNFLTRKKEREAADAEGELDALLGSTEPAPVPTPSFESERAVDALSLAELGLDDGDPIELGTGTDGDLEDRLGTSLGRDIPNKSSPLIYTPDVPILNRDFHEFAAEYTGPKFNFIHCDFPYGINIEKHHGSGTSFESYADSRDVYFELLDTLAKFTTEHVAESAHLMFWYAFKFHRETEDALRAMGWTLHERPLIWHRSDNSGVLPDPKRGPRWVYETAIMASRGDRPVVQAVSNCIPHPNTKEVHKSEKPINMLHHFFRMFVDGSTRMIDPTAGSGNAVYTAEAMGAKSVLGLERDKGFHENACAHYLKQKAMFSKLEV